ncbi:MAG: hypothetical protein AAF541_24400, partial [Pseudomonadota bacterium]
AACAGCVCGADPFCCDTAWDAFCVECAYGGDSPEGTSCSDAGCDTLCGCPGPAPTLPSDCCAEHAGSGCSDAPCAGCVGAIDSFCATVVWDAFCVELSGSICDDACQCPERCPGAGGACDEANGSAGCDDASCCANVCATDPYCCEVIWDAACATTALFACGLVGPCPAADPLCAFCGNGTCANGESCASCPADCGACPACELPTCADPARTLFVGGPGTQACQVLSGDEAACNAAFHVGNNGDIASCVFDDFDGSCRGCGPARANAGACTDACDTPPECSGDPSRTLYAGGHLTAACLTLSGDDEACNSAFHGGRGGLAPCFVNSGFCFGCGPTNAANGECVGVKSHEN